MEKRRYAIHDPNDDECGWFETFPETDNPFMHEDDAITYANMHAIGVPEPIEVWKLVAIIKPVEMPEVIMAFEEDE